MVRWCFGGFGAGEFTRDLLFHAVAFISAEPCCPPSVAQISPRVMAEKVGESPPKKKKEKHKSKEKA